MTRTLLTDLVMLQGGTPVPSQILVDAGRIEACLLYTSPSPRD